MPGISSGGSAAANNARSSLIRLRSDHLRNRIDLHLVLGGDFTIPESSPPFPFLIRGAGGVLAKGEKASSIPKLPSLTLR